MMVVPRDRPSIGATQRLRGYYSDTRLLLKTFNGEIQVRHCPRKYLANLTTNRGILKTRVSRWQRS